MRIEHEKVQNVKQALKDIMRSELDLRAYKVFFFGSRVTGSGHERSDIDVGIVSKQPVPPARLAAIQEKVAALPFLYYIDIVDFSNVSDDFRDVALQKTEPI